MRMVIYPVLLAAELLNMCSYSLAKPKEEPPPLELKLQEPRHSCHGMLHPAMDGSPRKKGGILSRLRSRNRTVHSSRRIVVGLKYDHYSREMLLRLLHSVVMPGDNVVAVHVQHSDDTFDPNTFHIHEDLCKSKQVDFEVRICTGRCYITELSQQVRLTFASILAVGCRVTCPDNAFTAKFLKALPPTCKLLIMDRGGKILFEKMGTSQQGCSTFRPCRTLMPSLSESCTGSDHPRAVSPIRKSFSLPTSSSTASTSQHSETRESITPNLSLQFLHKLAMLEAVGYCRCFTLEELNSATQEFGPDMLIGRGTESQVFRATLENGQAAVLKVVKTYDDRVFQELKILSGLKHENIVQILGYCHCKEFCAIVYGMVNASLKQRLNLLRWCERMRVAIGVAKGLEYLHSCYPPIIHKAVNSANILLSVDGNPRLAGFGAAKAYLAPEYTQYGKVDEKVDVYSYGVVLLELITGREDIRANSISNQESLVLWARSLVTCGQYEHLVDPSLNGDYKEDEMEAMITAARFCLLHSYSRRPTMKTILRLLEDPNCKPEMQTYRENVLARKHWTQR